MANFGSTSILAIELGNDMVMVRLPLKRLNFLQRFSIFMREWS